MSFDKSALFAALKPKVKSVEIDGFGAINVRQLSVAEVGEIRAKLKKSNESDDAFGLNLVVMSYVDADGSQIFSEGDMQELAASSNAAMEALVSASLEMNGFKKAAEAKN